MNNQGKGIMLIRHPCLGAQAELYLGPRGLRAYFPRVEFQELRTQFMERGFDMEIGQYQFPGT